MLRVGGMAVEREDDSHHRHAGDTYSCFSASCRKELVAKPDRFTARLPQPT